MREPPANLPDETLRACLRARYGLIVDELTFLPIGHDSSAWVYRARTVGDGAYFLKVRTQVTNEPGLLVPRYLRDHGVERVVAPLLTGEGALWTTAGAYALILYPFVAGTTATERGMSERQWIDYGAILGQIHATTPASDLARMMRRETFTPVGARTIEDVGQRVRARSYDHPAAHELAAFWRSRQGDIRTLLQRADDLGRHLARKEPPFVLCHADIHTNNVMLDADGQVWIVDWDETVLAPRERDLMFVIGGLVGPRQEELFFQGYGETSVDPLALAYYRYARAVEDIGDYGEQVFLRPDLGPGARRAAVEGFMSLFTPGSIVSLAFASDDQAT